MEVPLQELATMNTTDNEHRVDDFVHLNALKVDWSSTLTVRGLYLTPSQGSSAISLLRHEQEQRDRYYNLNGQQVARPAKGLYLREGRKVFVR